MSQSHSACRGFRRAGAPGISRRIRHFIIRFAFTGVWIALPLLPLAAILLTWLNGL